MKWNALNNTLLLSDIPQIYKKRNTSSMVNNEETNCYRGQ
jgi:hypothetical protein